MKRNTISIFFSSNGILILKDKVVTNHQLPSVDNYKVINSQDFIRDLSLIFKNQNINRRLLTDNIQILIDSSYSIQDIHLLESIFKELSFNKIEFINWIDIPNTKEDSLLINISKNVKIYYKHKTYIVNIIYNKYTEILSQYLKILINRYSISNIKIFGDNKNIHSIRDELEHKLDIKTYIYSNNIIYPLELLF